LAAIIIGIIGGLMGSFFININTRMNFYRGKILKTKWSKPIETFWFCFIIATTFYFVSYGRMFRERCLERPKVEEG